MTSPQSLSAPERALYSKLHRLLHHAGILRGGLVEMRRRCGKKSCRCYRDPDARHRSLYVAVSFRAKRSMVYVPPHWEDRVREWVGRHAQIKEILEEISLHSLERLQKREE